jgi:hypothetical protein
VLHERNGCRMREWGGRVPFERGKANHGRDTGMRCQSRPSW